MNESRSDDPFYISCAEMLQVSTCELKRREAGCKRFGAGKQTRSAPESWTMSFGSSTQEDLSPPDDAHEGHKNV